MSLIKGKIDDEKGKETLFAQKVWNLICRALLMSGTSLKAIANKALEATKKNLGEVLPQTEEVQATVEPTPLISPIYKGNPVVELGNKIAGTDLTEPQPVMLNPEEMEAIKNVKLPEDAPVISQPVISTETQEDYAEVQQPNVVTEPVIPTPNQEVVSTESQVVPMPEQPVKVDESAAIPSIVPPTFATAVVSENASQTASIVSEEVIPTKTQVVAEIEQVNTPVVPVVNEEVVSTETQVVSPKDEEEASVESAITMATVNQSAAREPKQELQTPQEFDNRSQVQEKVDEVSTRYIDAVSLLEKYRSDAEKTLVALQEANEAQSRALSEFRKQISMLSNIQRMLEQERVGQISSIKEALDSQDKALNPDVIAHRNENVR